MNNLNLDNKILLVQLFANGDCLYATTIARQIKKDYPSCHLTWAVATSCRSILINNPYVDEIQEVNDVPKNDVSAFRKLKKKLKKEKESGLWKDVFITHIMDDNQAYYDGCIRSTIFRAYGSPVTVDFTPILQLSENEKYKAKEFALKNNLDQYEHRILFEFAPQSGQLPITTEIAVRIAEKITGNTNTVVILSSANRITHPDKSIVDGSLLTLRETAALSFYCTHLIGCSSGITWLTTSSGARLLPMIQIINPYTDWVNPISRDFKRLGKSTDFIIDIIDFDEQIVCNCAMECLKDFASAKRNFHQEIPLQFKTTRKIIYNLLCYLQSNAIAKHIKINIETYGHDINFYKEVFLALLFFPFKLIRNKIVKWRKG